MPKFTSYMLSNQPDQTAYLLNKLAQEGVGGGEGGKLYPSTGQHTDGAMTQKATTDALGTKADTITVGNQLATKVDKETGKGLSSNDFTDEDLTKLNGIEAGAEVNVQADWGQTDNTADDYIKNKPTIPAGTVLYPSTGQNTDGAMTQKASTDLFNVAAYIDTGTIGSPTPWVDTSDIVDGAVTPDKLSQAYVKTAGDTMTGQLTMSGSGNGMIHLVNGASGTDTMYKAERTDTGTEVEFGIGGGGINHGIYSSSLDKWMIYGNASSNNIYVNNIKISKETLAVDSFKAGSFTLNTDNQFCVKYGTNQVFLSMGGSIAGPVTAGTRYIVGTLPSGWRPYVNCFGVSIQADSPYNQGATFIRAATGEICYVPTAAYSGTVGIRINLTFFTSQP